MARTNPQARQWAHFQEETADHQLVIAHEDGLYRDLRVQAPQTSMWGWGVITWPGHLATFGDIADGYMFRRLKDMLDFFRVDKHLQSYYSDGAPCIDFHYWAEKLTGGRAQDVQMYSSEAFIRAVEQCLDESETLSEEAISAEEHGFKHSLLKQQRQDYLEEAKQSSETEEQASQFLYSRAGDGVIDHDFFEINIRDWDIHFLFTCWAIALTVELYDAADSEEQ